MPLYQYTACQQPAYAKLLPFKAYHCYCGTKRTINQLFHDTVMLKQWHYISYQLNNTQTTADKKEAICIEVNSIAYCSIAQCYASHETNRRMPVIVVNSGRSNGLICASIH